MVVTLPIITRLYTPSEYAGYAIALAASLVLSTIVSGRYEMVCVVAARDHAGDCEAWKVARLATVCALASSVLLQLSALLLVVGGVNSVGVTPEVLMAVPTLTFLTAVNSIQTLLDTRLGNYHTISFLTAVRACVLCVLQIVFGLLFPSAHGLIIALCISLVPGGGRLGYLLARRSPGRFHLAFRALARRHRRYPQFQVWAALANSLSVNFLVLVVASAYGDAQAGLFAVASRIAFFPTSVIAVPVNTVYFREVAGVAADKSRVAALYGRATRVLGLASVAIYSAIAVATPLFAALLGNSWQSSAWFILALVPMGVALCLGAPANSTLTVQGRQVGLLMWRLTIVFVGPALVLTCTSVGANAPTAVGFSSIGVLVVTILYVLWTRRSLLSHKP